jgi:hypothetical protein
MSASSTPFSGKQLSPQEEQIWQHCLEDFKKLQEMGSSYKNIRERKRVAVSIVTKMINVDLTHLSADQLSFYNEKMRPALAASANALDDVLEKLTREYFADLFNQKKNNISKVIFHPKEGSGVQHGKVMEIQYTENESKDDKVIKYYIKTHQHGSISGSHGSVKPVDPKELLVYKVLEHLGIGPKAHFILNMTSSGGLYIATQDSGFSKQSQKKKNFNIFSKIKNQFALFANNQNTESLASSIDERDILGITEIDIISRILKIHDTSTNSDNFGRVSVDSDTGQDKVKWKIIDFRVDSSDTYTYHDIVEGFLSGNGMFNYDGFLRQVLKDRPEKDRVMAANVILQGLLSGRAGSKQHMPLAEALSQGYQEVMKLVDSGYHAMGIKDPKLAQEDLTRYFQSISENFKQFAQGIQVKVNSMSSASTSQGAKSSQPSFTH